MSEVRAWAYISVVSVLWLALIIVGAVSGNLTQFSTIADIVPLLLLGSALFEHWVWRWPPLHPHVVRTPIVRGTWKGVLETMWKDPATMITPSPKTVYLAIDQTLTSNFTRLMTDESPSEQVAGTLARRGSGRRFLAVVYQNTPPIDRREASPIHFGGMILDIYGAPPEHLEGEYWTDRLSKGKLTFQQHHPIVAESYEEADRLDFGEGSAN